MPTGPTPRLEWIRPPQQARSQDTLDRILDAAEGLLAEKGFEDTTVSDVVSRAGSSVGAFYTRFHDKDGLLYALYERYLAQAMATADVALDPARWEKIGVAGILRAVTRFLVSIYREQEGLIRAFVIRNHTDAEFRARQARLSHHVNVGLGRLLLARAGEIRREPHERAVAFGLATVFATLESLMLFGETRSQDLRVTDDELAEELAAVFLAYLGVPEGAPIPHPPKRRARKESPR